MQIPGQDEWRIVYPQTHRRHQRDHRVTCIDVMEFDAAGFIKPVKIHRSRDTGSPQEAAEETQTAQIKCKAESYLLRASSASAVEPLRDKRRTSGRYTGFIRARRGEGWKLMVKHWRSPAALPLPVQISTMPAPCGGLKFWQHIGPLGGVPRQRGAASRMDHQHQLEKSSWSVIQTRLHASAQHQAGC